MLSIKEFATRYDICPSWAYQQIKLRHLETQLINGQHYVAPNEAERWLSEQLYRSRVKIISRPELPPIVLGDGDFRVLRFCGRSYNILCVEARISMRWRVERLRERGFTIERGWRRGTHPYYRLKDVIEVDFDTGPWRIGPHPDYLE